MGVRSKEKKGHTSGVWSQWSMLNENERAYRMGKRLGMQPEEPQHLRDSEQEKNKESDKHE